MAGVIGSIAVAIQQSKIYHYCLRSYDFSYPHSLVSSNTQVIIIPRTRVRKLVPRREEEHETTNNYPPAKNTGTKNRTHIVW